PRAASPRAADRDRRRMEAAAETVSVSNTLAPKKGAPASQGSGWSIAPQIVVLLCTQYCAPTPLVSRPGAFTGGEGCCTCCVAAGGCDGVTCAPLLFTAG